jgi:Cysteine-rich domain
MDSLINWLKGFLEGRADESRAFHPLLRRCLLSRSGIATLQLLEKLGCSVEYPLDQTCCGQPMANSGCQDDAATTEVHFIRCFQDFDTVVGPSGSCVHHVRFHLDAVEQTLCYAKSSAPYFMLPVGIPMVGVHYDPAYFPLPVCTGSDRLRLIEAVEARCAGNAVPSLLSGV